MLLLFKKGLKIRPVIQNFKKEVNLCMSFTEWLKLRWFLRSEEYISKKWKEVEDNESMARYD